MRAVAAAASASAADDTKDGALCNRQFHERYSYAYDFSFGLHQSRRGTCCALLNRRFTWEKLDTIQKLFFLRIRSSLCALIAFNSLFIFGRSRIISMAMDLYFLHRRYWLGQFLHCASWATSHHPKLDKGLTQPENN
jgi:hypothetical protein